MITCLECGCEIGPNKPHKKGCSQFSAYANYYYQIAQEARRLIAGAIRDDVFKEKYLVDEIDFSGLVKAVDELEKYASEAEA